MARKCTFVAPARATRQRCCSGFGGDTTSWGTVEPALATQTRVCSYDRPGTGTSDPATSTATFSTQATDLHALLRTVGEPGPYVVVGHSFGGAEAVMFASLFADEVAGLVLIDASPTTWPAALRAVPDDGSEAAAILSGLCTDTFPPNGNSEQLDVIAAFAEVAQIVSLGSLPMAVITATHRKIPLDLYVRSPPPQRNVGPRAAVLADSVTECTPGVGRAHWPPHPDRPTWRRHRSDHLSDPITQPDLHDTHGRRSVPHPEQPGPPEMPHSSPPPSMGSTSRSSRPFMSALLLPTDERVSSPSRARSPLPSFSSLLRASPDPPGCWWPATQHMECRSTDPDDSVRRVKRTRRARRCGLPTRRR